MARILSIEDDPELQHLVSYALRNQGWEVHYAFTGPEGHEKALELNPDLILLDMMLPALNGVEVAKLLKAKKSTRDIPIIVLTGYPTDANFMESGIKALGGAVEYLRKPVQLDELVRLIKRMLARGGGKRKPAAVWEKGAFRLTPDSKGVFVDGRLVATLAPKRFEVLYHLLQASGEVAWEELVHKVWGRDGTKNDLEKTIQRLRHDLGAQAYRLSTTRRGYQILA